MLARAEEDARLHPENLSEKDKVYAQRAQEDAVAFLADPNRYRPICAAAGIDPDWATGRLKT